MRRPLVLLTGRKGFTGVYVAAALEAEGYDVVGLSDVQATGDAGSTSVNLLDRDGLTRVVNSLQPNVVINLAAVSFVAHGNAEEIYRVNMLGTRNLLEALEQSGTPPELVVLASSANIYGNTKVAPITEDTAPAPANDYAVSKLAMEYIARLWTQKLPIVVTRPFNYTGVGQSPNFLIPKIVDHFRRREKVIELGNTQVDRDFGDVRDVATAYSAIVRSGIKDAALNICTGVGHSLNDVLDLMADIAGYRIEVKVNPAFVRANEVRRLVGSSAKLARLTGWRPQYSLRHTLAWMYKG